MSHAYQDFIRSTSDGQIDSSMFACKTMAWVLQFASFPTWNMEQCPAIYAACRSLCHLRCCAPYSPHLTMWGPLGANSQISASCSHMARVGKPKLLHWAHAAYRCPPPVWKPNQLHSPSRSATTLTSRCAPALRKPMVQSPSVTHARFNVAKTVALSVVKPSIKF